MKDALPHLRIKPVKKHGIAEERIEHELFLYPQHSDQVHVLNSGAALIWMLCDGVRDVACIASELATSFHLSEQQTLNDVLEIVAQLQALGLLESTQH